MAKTKKTYPKSRKWCFSDFELLDMTSIYDSQKDIIRYLCYGEELCPKTKKKHYQGWIQFFNQKRLSAVKKAFGTKKLHLEPCNGTEEQNDLYCKKDGVFHEFGKFVTQGARTDLEHVKQMLTERKPMLEVANAHFGDFIRYHRGFYKYDQLLCQEQTKAFRKVKVILLRGTTGKGKTRLAMKYSTFKIQGSQLQWWDGYQQDKIICIDEYNNDVGITHLLDLLDGYQLRLPIKGGFTYANWDTVYLTTNLEILHINAKQAHQDALKRRIKECITFHPNGDIIRVVKGQKK